MRKNRIKAFVISTKKRMTKLSFQGNRNCALNWFSTWKNLSDIMVNILLRLRKRNYCTRDFIRILYLKLMILAIRSRTKLWPMRKLNLSPSTKTVLWMKKHLQKLTSMFRLKKVFLNPSWINTLSSKSKMFGQNLWVRAVN